MVVTYQVSFFRCVYLLASDMAHPGWPFISSVLNREAGFWGEAESLILSLKRGRSHKKVAGAYPYRAMRQV